MTKRAWILYTIYFSLVIGRAYAKQPDIILTKSTTETIITGKRLYSWDKNDSAGVVTDTLYAQCFWPHSDVPIRPFAAGSARIRVQGPPTPRNIIFPVDTVFLNGTNGVCFSTATVTNKDVLEPQDFTADVVVDGALRPVRYTKPVTVNEPVKDVFPIDVATARALAK